MLAEEGIMEIRIFSRRGMGIRAIAKELGISRNAVRKYLRGDAVKPLGHRKENKELNERINARFLDPNAPEPDPSAILYGS